jgi:hypothetical protein
MPRKTVMSVYEIYVPADGDWQYFHSFDGAKRFAKAQAALLRSPVTIMSCEIAFPNKRTFVAALNREGWSSNTKDIAVIYPSKFKGVKP